MLYQPRLLHYMIGDRVAIQAEEMYGAFGTISEICPLWSFEYAVHIDGSPNIDWLFHEWELVAPKVRGL